MGLALVHQPGIVTFLFACPKRKVTKRKKVPSTREQSQRPAGIALLFNRGPSFFFYIVLYCRLKRRRSLLTSGTSPSVGLASQTAGAWAWWILGVWL